MSYAASASFQRTRVAVGDQAAPFALGLFVAPVLAVNGGFYPTSWGWSALALGWAAVLGALLRPLERPGRAELVFVLGLCALAGWTALSMFWTESRTQTMLELQRTLVYVGGAAAVVAIVRRDRVTALLGGLTAGIVGVSAWGLATRLFPNGLPSASYGGLRLSTPIGYWNGLGLVAGMGLILSATFAAKAASAPARAIAGAGIPIAVTTLYFTFSRGAWLSLLVGLGVLVAAERRRLQLILSLAVPAVVCAVVVWRASAETALTREGATLSEAVHQGRSLAALVLGGCLVCGYAAVAARRLESRRELPAEVERAARWAVPAAIVLALVVAFAVFGAPWTLARHAYDSFTSAPLADNGNLNNRLFSLSSNGRIAAWKVAWHAFGSSPIGGIGAGAFGIYWNAHRHAALTILDAHSLYLETLAELGLVGLALLASVFVAPFTAVRAVRGPAVGAAGALAAYLVGAAADWHWELAGVTLCAVLCGGALLAAVRPDEPILSWRALPLGAGTAVALLGLAGLGGNLLLSASGHALRSGHLASAVSDAKRARTWVPWSSQPWQRLGDAYAAAGLRQQAVVSYRTAVAKDPRNEQLWIDLAQSAQGAERARALARAKALNPLDPTVDEIKQQLGAS